MSRTCMDCPVLIRQETIAHDETRWIGRIIDALFRVEAAFGI